MALRKRLVAAGVTTLIIGLIVTFPARVAYRWFAPPSVLASGLNGSVWLGQASQAQAKGIYLQDLRWRFRPLAVFTGKVAFAVEGNPGSGFADATVSVGVSGSIVLRDLEGSLPLGVFEQIAGMPGLRGTARLQFERVVIDSGVPTAANGELAVAGLVAPRIYRGNIGGYRAEFFTQNSGVMASVEDTDGVVDLAGSLQISPDGAYRFIGLVAPKAATPERLRQQMPNLGTANERGQYELRLEGEF